MQNDKAKQQFIDLNPDSKAEYALKSLEYQGFQLKKSEQPNFLKEVKSHIQSNPKIDRTSLTRYVFSKLDNNQVEEQEAPQFQTS